MLGAGLSFFGGPIGAALGGGLGAASGLSSGAQSISQAFAPGGLIGSDERLKEDIHDLDLKDCFESVIEMPLKSWRYLEETGLDTDVHLGPMAQDAPECIRGEMNGIQLLNLHDELMLIAGALQYMRQEGMLKCH